MSSLSDLQEGGRRPGHGVTPVIRGLGAHRLLESDTRMIVTGAGGWLGLATLEMLHSILGQAFQRRVVCFGSSARVLTLRGGTQIAQQPLAALADLSCQPSLVLHLAFLTQQKNMAMSADEFVEANRGIAQQVSATLERVGALGIFVASSGAAYLADRAGGPESKELYGWLKLEDEARFDRWRRETGKAAVIARVFNLSGPYINRRSSYALASFVADALANRPISIRATNRVYRSYVSIEELMSVAVGVLTDRPGKTVKFDTAGEATYELGEIAEAVQVALGRDLGVRRPPLSSEQSSDRYVGDGKAFAALRRELSVPELALPDQIRQTAAYMAEFPDES